MAHCLQARYVFPVVSAPIEHGTVTVAGDRIVRVGPQAEGAGTIQLGNVALLPGLVNAHTHLQLSDLVPPMAGPGVSFVTWLQALIEHRRQQVDGSSVDPYRQVQLGLDESVGTGTTLLGDITNCSWLPDEPRLRQIACVVFRELLGCRADHLDAHLAAARDHITVGQRPDCSWQPGVSPHAPYTTNVELVQEVARLSAKTRVPMAMHLAESVEEIELLASHSGPLVQLLADVDAWDPSAMPRGIQPGDYLQLLAPAHRALVIHGNYLTGEDWDYLAARSDRMSVVFCPRTHAYFGHGRYPLAEMLERGVRVCLGTDSRASNPDLNLFAEVHHVAAHHADVSPAEALRLGTLAGAEALGWADQLGSIASGKRANLIAVRLPEDTLRDPYELLFASTAAPAWVMRDGRID